VTFDFGTRITEEQVRSLFKSIENGNNVKKLYLEEMNLESIEDHRGLTQHEAHLVQRVWEALR